MRAQFKKANAQDMYIYIVGIKNTEGTKMRTALLVKNSVPTITKLKF